MTWNHTPAVYKSVTLNIQPELLDIWLVKMCDQMDLWDLSLYFKKSSGSMNMTSLGSWTPVLSYIQIIRKVMAGQ